MIRRRRAVFDMVMHESIPGVTIPPREHTRAFDLIGPLECKCPGAGTQLED